MKNKNKKTKADRDIEKQEARAAWLAQHGRTEGDVMVNGFGEEYILDIDEESGEKRRRYLP